jgi:hypothetical protein
LTTEDTEITERKKIGRSEKEGDKLTCGINFPCKNSVSSVSSVVNPLSGLRHTQDRILI